MVAVTSSTEGEVFIVSLASKSVVRSVSLGSGAKGKVKAESLCALSAEELLVADGAGTLCRVDLSTQPATAECVATSPDNFRVTSVAAVEGYVFAAGAPRNQKTRCSVRRVDLTTQTILEDALVEAPMVRALCADDRTLYAGAIDVANEEAEDATTTICAWSAGDVFQTTRTVGEIDVFVHAIAKHPGHSDVFILLARHTASTFDCPIRVVRFESAGPMSLHAAKCAILATLPIDHHGLVSSLTKHTFAASFGVRAGREHAMAVAPDGRVVTGSVDKDTKGVLQVWRADLIFSRGEGKKKKQADQGDLVLASSFFACC